MLNSMKKYVLLNLFFNFSAFNVMAQLELKLKCKVADSIQNSFYVGK
jgi:hypothetical protein